MTPKILITGVHQGLGNALARHYLATGSKVTGISRHCPEPLMENPSFRFVSMDLAELKENPPIINALAREDGPYTLVYLNAGILGAINWMERQTMDDIHHLMNVNVWANKVILDALKSHAPDTQQVIAVSSGAAIFGSCGWGPYSISKAALNCLIRIHADEWPSCHMTALAPGLIGTAILDHVFHREPNEAFPADTRLRQSRIDGLVQTPETCARRIANVTAVLKQDKSGLYKDIRNID